ncbi:hypothetical protein MTO96_017448 [Rhipicephalus appendiculatus]
MQTSAYVVALVHMRSSEYEQFQALVEKVFLQLTTSGVWNFARKRITRRLHAVYAAGVFWMISSLASQLLNIYAGGTLNFQWIYVSEGDEEAHYFLLAALVLTLMFHDVVSMTLATSYAIHCQLVLVYLQNMSQAVRERRTTFLEFYRGVGEARKSVRYLNKRHALAVTVQTLWVASRTVVCFYALLGTPWTQWQRFVAAWLNVAVWFSLLLIPPGAGKPAQLRVQPRPRSWAGDNGAPFRLRQCAVVGSGHVPSLYVLTEDAGQALRPTRDQAHGRIRVPVHRTQLVHVRAA